MTAPPRLPAFARALLRICPLGDRRSDVEADFAELFERRRRRHGRAFAIRRLLRDAASVLLPERASFRPASRAGTPGVSHWKQDVSGALRLFRKRPGVIGATVGGLAIAIAVCTVVFTIVNASALRPYGMEDPGSVVRVQMRFERGMSTGWPYAAFVQLQQARLAQVEASLFEGAGFALTPDDAAVRTEKLLLVSDGYLSMLGARARYGRTLVPADAEPGAQPVVVLNHGFWTRRLNADGAAIGRTVWLSGVATTIVGVLDPSFTGPEDIPPSFWAPLASNTSSGPLDRSSAIIVNVIARVTKGAEPAAAEAELSAIAANLPATRIDADTDATANVTAARFEHAASPLAGNDTAEVALIVSLLFVIVGLVLALACANVANLLLAGAASRAHEIGVRLAMGATRARIMRQLLNESLLIGGAAGLLGLLLSFWLVPFVAIATGMPPTYDLRLDGRVLLFACGVALVAGIGAGVTPARYGSRRDVTAVLKSDGAQSGASPGAWRLRRWFIGFQAAAAIVLLVTAALFTRAAWHVATVDLGVDADRLLAVTPAFGRSFPNDDVDAYWRAALDRVRAITPVENAALVLYPPFGGAVGIRDVDHHGRRYRLFDNRSDAAFFDTAGVRIVRGRAYSAAEVAGNAPVVVISENVVRDFFGEDDPIGASLGNVSPKLAGLTVIGVVQEAETSRLQGLSGTIYQPLDRVTMGAARLVVRAPQPAAIARDVERTILAVDSRARPAVTVVSDAVEEHLREPRVLAAASSAIALVALLLAVLGMHGVTAFVVGERAREISVRIAIGGSAGAIVRLLVRQSLTPVMAGLAVGILAASGFARLLAPGLPGISPNDPFAVLSGVIVLIVTSIAAVLSPALRAANCDPSSVLRA